MNYHTRWRIRISGLLHGESSKDLRFSYRLTLPFVPVVGMEVSFGHWSASAEKIWYDADNEVFHCFVEPVRIHPNDIDEQLEVERDSLLKAGWQQDI
jgi:hypothetical protein